MSPNLYRDQALQLGHKLDGFGIQDPTIQIPDVVLEQGRHAGASRLNIPVVACIICIRPIEGHEANKCARDKLPGMLVQILAKLGPIPVSSDRDGVVSA